MSALRALRVSEPIRRIGVSPVSDLARRRASLPTDAGGVAQLPNCRRSRSWPETGFETISLELNDVSAVHHLKGILNFFHMLLLTLRS
jgi:hypothetical protein